eukprot:2215712-Amphidinium_carterae.1
MYDYLQLLSIEAHVPAAGVQWKKKHDAMRKGLGKEGLEAPLWSSSHDMKGITTARAEDVVNLCYQMTQDKSMVVDVSQDASRAPWCQKV